MCAAIADCANVDEVAGIERQFAEIRLRACIRIGEISRDLEKSNLIKLEAVGIPPMGSRLRPSSLSTPEYQPALRTAMKS